VLGVYKACLDSLRVGGVVVIKDQIRAGKRITFGFQHQRLARKVGFTCTEWYQHSHIGKAFGYWNLSIGVRQITEEHILMFRKDRDG